MYKDLSKKVMAILKDFSPNVEVCSIDEGFVDFTGLCKLYKTNIKWTFYVKKVLTFCKKYV